MSVISLKEAFSLELFLIEFLLHLFFAQLDQVFRFYALLAADLQGTRTKAGFNKYEEKKNVPVDERSFLRLRVEGFEGDVELKGEVLGGNMGRKGYFS